MHFLIKRYLYGLRSRRNLLFLALIPPLGYLMVMMAIPSEFVVSQEVVLSSLQPLAKSSSPVDIELAGDVVKDPKDFFRDAFAVRELDSQVINGQESGDAEQRIRRLTSIVTQTLQMNSPAEGSVVVTYTGPDGDLGKDLVAYFSTRLIRKAEDGDRRAVRLGLSSSEASGNLLAPGLKDIESGARWNFWRPNVVRVAGWILLVSLMIILVVLGAIEWSDPSFKSERQVGRYLNVPVLGSVSELGEISRRIS